LCELYRKKFNRGGFIKSIKFLRRTIEFLLRVIQIYRQIVA
jgi:hypothetical protein